MHANLEDPDPDLVDAAVDPRSLFELEWGFSGEGEAEGNEQPGAPTGAAYVSTARLIEGTLEGIGWANGGEPRLIEGPECGSTGTRSPALDSGDYIGDVDVFNITMLEDGHFCARLMIDEESAIEERGWDMLLFPLDACDVPLSPVTEQTGVGGEPPAPLGFSFGGSTIDWSHPVRTGESYAVLVAGFVPNDPDVVIPYQLGLSLIASPPDEREVLCPLLPSEVSP